MNYNQSMMDWLYKWHFGAENRRLACAITRIVRIRVPDFNNILLNH